MDTRPMIPPPLQGLVALAAVIIVGSAIVQLKTLINPLLLAVLFFVLFSPMLNWLKRLGLPNIPAVFATMIVMILLVSVTVNLLAVSLEDFVRDMPNIYRQLQVRLDELIAELPFTFELPGMDEQLAMFINGEQFVDLLTSSLQGVVRTLSNLLLIVLLVLFMLLEATHLASKVEHLPSTTASSVADLTSNIKRYLVIKSFFSLLTGVLIGGFLWVYGIEYPLLMGALAFLLNFIPAIGSIVAAIPTLMLVFVNHGLIDVGVVLTWYVCVNLSIGNFFEPRQMGKEMGLSPLVVFLSLMLWGWMLGPIGMFMAVPLSMTIKIILSNYPPTRWLALMMG